MEVYGQTGYVLVPESELAPGAESGTRKRPSQRPPPLACARRPITLSYLAAVVRGEIRPAGLSSLEMNMIVTEILDAARESARSGRRIDLAVAPPKGIAKRDPAK